MKKISTAAALLAAGALLFGSLIVACSPHGTGIIDDPTSKPTPASEEEDNGKPVDGSWDFTGTDTYSIGHSDYASLTDKALTNPTAKGATLTLSGSVKWGNGSATDTSNFCLWFDKGSEYKAGKEDSNSKGHFTLTIDNMSTLTIVATGNGSSDTVKRWIAVCNKDKKVLTNGTLTALSSGDAADKKLNIKLPKAGTYYIYTSGTRIRSLQITNQAFESKTKEITNDAETLGLVATDVRNSDDTIATGEVKDGKIVITSKKEGTAKVYTGTSLTEYATINVTVSSTGAITTNIIKYVAFTAATNDATANNIETLGLVGASATSSASEYVTAEISEGKIVIKSVKAPGDSAKNVTITVANADGKTATIQVTEDRDGSLTLGNITKYAVPKPVSGTDFEVSADKKLTAKKDNMEYKLSTATEYTALTANTPTAALENGSYSIRFKAAVDNAYAASEDTSFTISNGGSVEYVLTPTDISSWIEAKTALTDITTSGANFKAGAGVTYDTSKLSSGSIKLGGYAQKDGKNSIQFTTTSANATVTVKFFGDGDSSVGRFVGMKSGNNKPFDSAGTANTESITDTNNSITAGGASNIVTATLIAPTAGLYTIGGSGAIYITELKISQTN